MQISSRATFPLQSVPPTVSSNRHRETRWFRGAHRLAPPALRYWLTLRGSLTQALQILAQGNLKVAVLNQYWGDPRWSECLALGLPRRQRCLIREVVLCGHQGQPWVFARSILPARTLVGPLHRLRRLDDRPLGEILFADRRIRRGPLEAALLVPNEHATPTLATLTAQPVWGRRSVFSLHRQPLLVTEVFLPNFPSHKRPSYNRR